MLQFSYKDDADGESGKPPVPKPTMLYGYSLVDGFMRWMVKHSCLSDLEDFGSYMLTGCARVRMRTHA